VYGCRVPYIYVEIEDRSKKHRCLLSSDLAKKMWALIELEKMNSELWTLILPLICCAAVPRLEK
jgi:hypothetical protein